MPETRFRCPGCAVVVEGGVDFLDHFAREPEHRQALVETAAELDPPTATGARCDAYAKIVRDLDASERTRFLMGGTCTRTRFDCACGNTTCSAHTVVCRQCGRPMCPRHRYTGKCEVCTGRSKPRMAVVDKHDPFSKRTTKVTRTYSRRPHGPWAPVDPDAYDEAEVVDGPGAGDDDAAP